MTTGTSETKAYRVWLTNENKLKISRDVIILDDDVDNNNIKIINEEHLLSENEFINNEDNEHEENMIQNYDNNTSINDGFKGFSPASISKSNQNVNKHQEKMNKIINLDLEQDNVTPRGKGRPIRTGGRGRPRKVYQNVQHQKTILRPAENQRDYYNRKRYHSIVLQVDATSDKNIIDFYVGEPGSMHDARVCRRLPMYIRAHAMYSS
ncbi:hypothetical protein HCN44_010327 [Aphidius gifuensis]|uniref:DDE Tnp4 domain-containing protein n=1 Tax=Aphidius gifuensis TaxID=684658 RepID=A0A834XW74_APHGI|nr:hypothetical protein HCN44_010327 [Aphidius gifuensis]